MNKISLNDDDMFEILKDYHMISLKSDTVAIIDFLRELQRKHIQDYSIVSGMSALQSMLLRGQINMALMLRLMPIVKDYDRPYEIIIT